MKNFNIHSLARSFNIFFEYNIILNKVIYIWSKLLGLNLIDEIRCNSHYTFNQYPIITWAFFVVVDSINIIIYFGIYIFLLLLLLKVVKKKVERANIKKDLHINYINNLCLFTKLFIFKPYMIDNMM